MCLDHFGHTPTVLNREAPDPTDLREPFEPSLARRMAREADPVVVTLKAQPHLENAPKLRVAFAGRDRQLPPSQRRDRSSAAERALPMATAYEWAAESGAGGSRAETT